MLAEYELGYLMGLIDGEGCFTISKAGKPINGIQHFHPSFWLNLHNKNKDVLEHIHNELGMGCIYYRPNKRLPEDYPRFKRTSPSFVFTIRKNNECRRLIDLIESSGKGFRIKQADYERFKELVLKQRGYKERCKKCIKCDQKP